MYEEKSDCTKENDVSIEVVMSKKKTMRRVILSFFIIIVLVALYLTWLYLQRPAVGEIRTSTVVSRTETDKNAKKEYRGTYLAFSLSTHYTEKAHTLPVKGPVKETILLTSDDVSGAKIAITVEEREGSDFMSSPSFQSRSIKPKEYTQQVKTLHGYTGVLFEKTTGALERTFFFRDADFIIIISLTTSMQGEVLEKEMDGIVESIHFLQ